jgi:gamma-glutamyl phosphate reductase
MRKLILIVMGFLWFSAASFAQQNQERGRDRERIQAARVAFMTEKMALTSQQAQVFWPMFNDYHAELRKIRSGYRSQERKMDINSSSEEELQKMISDRLKLKEAELTLERGFTQKALEIVSVKQFLQMQEAEEEFRRMMIRRLRQGGERPNSRKD